MKSTIPEKLLNHRVFFTEFDRLADSKLILNIEENDFIFHSIERKLKLLLLTKAHIIIAVSQLLESPLAHKLLRQYPDLLTSEALIPSLRSEYDTSTSFLTWKRNEAQSDKNNPYHTKDADEIAKIIDENGTAVRWALTDMSDWFRDRLVNDLEDDQSLLRLTLKQSNIIIPTTIASEISSLQGLTRGKVLHIIENTRDDKLIYFIKVYSDFIYYLSGARTTRSEGVLPQENLVDFTLSDLIGRKTKLSEYEIFFKIFIDTVKAKTSTIFPTDFLDAISIQDAIELRHIALTKNFTEKYNSIQIKTKEALQLHDPEKLVLLLNELEEFEAELYDEFSVALEKELPTRIREMKKRSTGKVIHSIASLLIPGYSPESYKDIIVNGLKIFGYEDAAKSIDKKINQGIIACESALENMSILDRQILLDYVDKLKTKYMTKMINH